MKKLLLISVLFYSTLNAYSQNWVAAEGIPSMSVLTIIKYNHDTLLAGVFLEGIYISYDNGYNWSQFALDGESVYSLIRIGDNLIAGTDGNDIYKTQFLETPFENIYINNLAINSLTINDDILYACTHGALGPGAVYTSIDNGDTWSQFSDTPPYAFLRIDFDNSGRTFVATPFGAYYSNDGSSWSQTSGLFGTTWSVAHLGNDSIVYGDDFAAFLSTDNGVTSQVLDDFDNGRIFYIDDTLYSAGTLPDLSSDWSVGWQSLDDLIQYKNSLIKNNGHLIAGTSNGVFLKFIGGASNINDPDLFNFNLFPNPTNNFIYFTDINSNNFLIEIIDLNGKIELVSSDSEIDVSFLSNGLYFYRITIGKESFLGKFIKE